MATQAARDPLFIAAVLLASLLFFLLRAHLRTLKRIETLEKDTRDAHPLHSTRRASTYPSAFPSGWYRVLGSDRLPLGSTEVVEVDAFATESFAVYRGQDGKVRVVDAYCPHLGAHLAQGGKVVDNCIQCPFHLWSFDGDSGKCTDIPYLEPGASIPSAAKVHVWPSVERYGQIFVYYSMDRSQPPAGFLIPKAECGWNENDTSSDGSNSPNKWRRVEYEGGRVSMSLQEFCENSVDFAHFQPLHGQMMVPWTSLTIPGIKIQHRASWEMSENKYFTKFRDFGYLIVGGRHLKDSGLNAEVTFVGPGGLVFFSKYEGARAPASLRARRLGLQLHSRSNRLSSPFLPSFPLLLFTAFHSPTGPITLLHMHLPRTSMSLDVHFSYHAPPQVPRFLVWYICGTWIAQWRNDLRVWENKVHRPRPVLAKGDGPVPRLRAWYNTFYPKGGEGEGERGKEWPAELKAGIVGRTKEDKEKVEDW